MSVYVVVANTIHHGSNVPLSEEDSKDIRSLSALGS